MDIERIIRDLKAERDRLNEIIVALEQLGKNDDFDSLHKAPRPQVYGQGWPPGSLRANAQILGGEAQGTAGCRSEDVQRLSRFRPFGKPSR